MLKKNVKSKERALTRIEVLAVLGSLALLTMIVLPVLAASSPRANRVDCLNNLRRIGQAFQTFANDFGDRFPWNIPSPGGTSSGTAVDCFVAARNELGTPRILVCPADGGRAKSSTWDFFASQNLSYFVGLHADLSYGRTWLSGDRNLQVNSETCLLAPSVTSWKITTNTTWYASIHANAGNLLFSDGSAKPCSNLDLTNYMQSALSLDLEGTNHISIP